jgi:hypothetical protein
MAGSAGVPPYHASRDSRLQVVIGVAPRWDWPPMFLLALERSGLNPRLRPRGRHRPPDRLRPTRARP